MVEIGEGYILHLPTELSKFMKYLGKYVIATLPLVIGPRGSFEVMVPTQVLIPHLRGELLIHTPKVWILTESYP